MNILDRHDGALSIDDSIDLEIVTSWIKSEDEKGAK
jgi:hypothetical protein